MISRQKARVIRDMIEKASASLSDSDALEAVELFPAWVAGETTGINYAIGDRVRYGGKLYKCVQAHTSQIGWEPPNVPALWTEVAKPGEIPVWKQPTGAQDAYMTGDKVHYPDADGPVWISTIDNNTWAPGVYGWDQI